MIDELAARLRPHYRRFLEGRSHVLMTGHSHQAWPDVSREAQLEAWDDAARLADEKWGRVFGEILPNYRARVAARLGSSTPGQLAFAGNTHELVLRFLSCFPDDAPIVTTDREFHSMRRQLSRLEEAGRSVTFVPAGEPIAPRLAPGSIALLSSVYFQTSEISGELPAVFARGVPTLVDAYHAFNVVPFRVEGWPAFVVGGGYKYAEHGEGACWMHVPPGAHRPRNTGWFADFGGLEASGRAVGYGPGGDAFLGATFDPTPYYRALRVLEWMDREGLSVELLRAQSLAQTGHLLARFDALALPGLGLATPREPERRGGFVAFTHARAAELVRALEGRGVRTDARGEYLRLGPAPYTTVAELDRAMDALAEVLR